MQYIHLTISKTPLIKYLQKHYQINIEFKDFGAFIQKFSQDLKSDLIYLIRTNQAEAISFIRNHTKDTSLLSFLSNDDMGYVNPDYFVSQVLSGRYDEFLTVKKKSFRPQTIQLALKIKLFNDFIEYFSNLKSTNELGFLSSSILKCFKANGIYFSDIISPYGFFKEDKKYLNALTVPIETIQNIDSYEDIKEEFKEAIKFYVRDRDSYEYIYTLIPSYLILETLDSF